jgi:hypothetical protein
MRKPKGKLVVVAWRDACHAIDYRPKGEFIMYTVGWLLKAGRKWTTVASEQGNKTEGRYRGYTRIPTDNVLKVWRLK